VAVARTSNDSIPVAQRVNRFTYAIRNIVVEAQRVEAAGKKVRFLNIGDRSPSGFRRRRIWSPSSSAAQDGHNGYGPSAGLAPRARRSRPVHRAAFRWARIACASAGTSEGIELARRRWWTRAARSRAMPTYPLYGGAREIGARARYYRTDPARRWMPDLDPSCAASSRPPRACWS
jgi:hypothetical protein